MTNLVSGRNIIKIEDSKPKSSTTTEVDTLTHSNMFSRFHRCRSVDFRTMFGTEAQFRYNR